MGKWWRRAFPPVAGLVAAGLVLAAIPAADATPATVRTAGAAALRIMPLGTSSTAGVGSPGTAGYRGPLWDDLRADGIAVDFVGSQHSGFPGMADVDHEGHAGWTLDRMLPLTGGWVRAARPDVVLLHIGTNDINTGVPAATVTARAESLLDAVYAAAPHTHVVLAGIWAALPEHRAARDAYNASLPALVATERAAGHSIDFVDTGALLQPGEFSDALHANASGYAAIAAMWDREIEAYLR
jgi:acyl-CoA thioesterase I